MLRDFDDLKSITGIRAGGKRHHLTTMRNDRGEIVSDRQGIADIFAAFYENLYDTQRTQYTDGGWTAASCKVPEVSAQEVKTCLSKMARKKAQDYYGIVVEMPQQGGDYFMQAVAQLFTDILDPENEPPGQWRETRLLVLHKKGERQDAGNYRPICVLSILYKAFSKIVCNRIRWILDKAQPVDQAGFRPGFGCDDQLLTMTLVWEKCNEFQLPLWVAAVDFRKAFDTVEHDSMSSALSTMGAPSAYIRVFAKLYSDQVGIVVTDRESRRFAMKRGTKQGDPTSPNIFNAFLEYALADAEQEWRRKGWGIDVGGGRIHTLCNLRFADDVYCWLDQGVNWSVCWKT